jgi:D-lactate dehydrogenase
LRALLKRCPAATWRLESISKSAGRCFWCRLDVFEGEEGYFYSDRSGEIMADDMFARLFMFSDVVGTGHQALFTEEALTNIAQTTIQNIKAFVDKQKLVNAVKI